MPDAESQSAITLKLNRLSTRHLLLRAAWPATVLRDLENGVPLVTIASAAIDGVVIASRPHERDHIARWPADQQQLIRQVLIEALRLGRDLAFDWHEGPGPAVTIRDFGYIVGVTFRSPPNY